MAWKVKFKKSAEKALQKLPRKEQEKIGELLDSLYDNPRKTGKAMKGQWAGYWRYRVGDYRIICQLRDQELIVLVVKIGQRGDVY